FDAAAQSRKRAQACADHAPLPLKTMGRPDLEREQELAHLFMICSNIKPVMSYFKYPFFDEVAYHG
ncbi:MAG: hypothetical protein ACRD3W_20555, partial [Terriglobales bacterium]